jgi:EmrB/QacA subfamily drug resistance transporter
MTASFPCPCDATRAAAQPSRGARHPQWTLFAAILASSLAFVDGSVVNVALPSIARSFNSTPAELQWTINAYLLPLSALLLVGGAAGDRFGCRRILLLGIGLFLMASIACAFAPGAAALLAARVVQGVGAAMLMPNSLAILGIAFSGEAKGKAAVASAAGPPLGGWLIDAIGWRSIFFVNVPIGAAALIVTLAYVDEGAEGGQPIDAIGAALVTLALGALTWSLTLWSNQHGASATAWGGLILGLSLLVGFLAIERARGEAAMMPLTLFGSTGFAGLTALTFLLYGALGGLLVLLPYLLIEIGQYSPFEAGLALLPFPLIIGVGSRTVGGITVHVGPKWLLGIGPLVAGLGFTLFHWIDPAASYVRGVLPGVLLIALGMAGVVAPLTTAVLSSVDDRHMGTASGFNSAIARTGGLIATALAGLVISRQGSDLLAAFHAAALAGAGLAFASGLISFLTLRDSPQINSAISPH